MSNIKMKPLDVKKIRTKSVNKTVMCKNTQKINSSSSLKTTDEINDKSKNTFGMSHDDAGTLLLRQVISCLPKELSNDEKYVDVVISMLLGINPQDELEGMIAAQMVATHLISMSMSGRCMLDGQTVDGVNANINRMAKLMRTFTNQLEALQKYRGKCNQTIQVQHVQVNDGGQAVIGNVHGGGDNG